MGFKMTRNYFTHQKPAYLSVCVNNSADRAVVKAFKDVATANGLSVQRALLQAAQDYVGAHQ